MKNFLTGLAALAFAAWCIWCVAALNGSVPGAWYYLAMIPAYASGLLVATGLIWLLGGWIRGDL